MPAARRWWSPRKTKALGVIYLKDIVKQGLPDRFQRFRAMGIKTVMITGDNPLTAAAIAKEAGVDDFLAQATPEDKLALLKKEQAAGHLVAMTGDGTNDAPALAQADVGVAMNTGTQAAKEAGNMVDLDSNPTKLIEVVEIGKQLLMTRGALTTFSIANDVAKYFAIIPAMLVGAYPQIAPLNIMNLGTPHSAILSAVIFNAIIIILLIPLALRGVKFRPASAVVILRRNLLIYGLGGILVPFPGIKIIDLRHPQSPASGLIARAHTTKRRQLHENHKRNFPIRRHHNDQAESGGSFLGNLWASIAATDSDDHLLRAYPLLIWAVAQTVFPHQANGSLVKKDGTAAVKDEESVGSSLIGPEFFPAAIFSSAPQRRRQRV